MAQASSERCNPDTAPAGQSIWKTINRIELERQTRSLHAKQHVAGHRAYRSIAHDDASYPLPFEVERSLADDIAFVAAAQPQVQYVTAVALEQSKSKPALVIRLAANEGASSDVKMKLEEILKVLAKHARKETTRESCQQDIFELILHLNLNKIMGRLGSAWFRRPTNLGKDQGPLPVRFKQLIQRNIRDRFPHRALPDLDRLHSQIEKFDADFRRLERGRYDDIVQNTKSVVKQAFELTQNGMKLPSRLKDLGCPDSQLDVREIRQVGKVANYWRISRHLAVCSRRFPVQFKSAELRFLPTFSPSTKSIAFPTQYVHAEIQLLVHYELTIPKLRPRVIGVSKEACFLCDSFIRAHERFAITGAHRQMYPQWTVPDLEQYSPSTVQNFQRTLAKVCVEVEREYLKSQQKTPWRPVPAQSAINLGVVLLKTPSTSTFTERSSASSASVAKTVLPRTFNRSKVEDSVSNSGCQHEHFCEKLVPALSPGLKKYTTSSNLEEVVPAFPVDVLIDEGVSDCVGWLRVIASSANLSHSQLPGPKEHRFVRATIEIMPMIGVECQRIVHMAGLSPHDELMLERDNDDLNQLSFLLVGEAGQTICVRCRWYTS